jgi:hypothetical protein
MYRARSIGIAMLISVLALKIMPVAAIPIGVALSWQVYRISSSAWKRSVGGMVRPRVWAVFSRVEDWRKAPEAPLGCLRRFQLRARVGSP